MAFIPICRLCQNSYQDAVNSCDLCKAPKMAMVWSEEDLDLEERLHEASQLLQTNIDRLKGAMHGGFQDRFAEFDPIHARWGIELAKAAASIASAMRGMVKLGKQKKHTKEEQEKLLLLHFESWPVNQQRRFLLEATRVFEAGRLGNAAKQESDNGQ
jgi:hypothetical protein